MIEQPQVLLHITCSRQDEPWVRGVLIPGLGLADGQYWTRTEDDLGAPVLTELQRAVESCRYTLLVASSAAKVDEWVQFASILAQHAGLEEGKPRLLLVARDFEPGSDRAKELLPLWQRCLVGHDCSDPERTALALTALAEQLKLANAIEAPPVCPYPGLRMFGEGDRDSHFDRPDLFFGRDAEGMDVIARLRRDHCVLLLGPSGCGKSSLVRARVLPELRRHTPGLTVAIARPGAQPDAALRAALDAIDPRLVPATDAYLDDSDEPAARAALIAAAPDIHGLLYLDQLEEAFIGAGPEHAAGSARCFARLAAIRYLPGIALLLAMRADFFGELMSSPAWDALQACRVELTPLRGAGLRLAITCPAEAVGVYVENDLVERLVREADMDRAAEALPLLQVALVQLWEHRQWRYLSLASYARIAHGERRGLDAVLADHADASMAALDETARVLARRVLIDLVHLGEGRPDTRRRRSIRELHRTGDAAKVMAQVMAHLSERRLMVIGTDVIALTQTAAVALHPPATEGATAERYADLAHDTLITGWPALSTWIAERRDDLRTQRRLEARAAGGGILADSELPEFVRWVAWLGTPAGRALGSTDALLDLTRRSAEAQRQRRIRRVSTVASVMIVLLTTTIVALYQRHRAIVARDGEARSRSRAEKLVDHLAYDLPEVLEAVGQPSAMQSSVAFIDDYYRSLQHDAPSLDPGQQRRLAAGRIALANVLLAEGEVDQAGEHFREALVLGEKLVRSHPSDSAIQRDLYSAHMGLAALRARLDAWKESLQETRIARGIVERLQARRTDDPQSTLDLAQALLREATVLLRVDEEDPRDTNDRAIALLEPLVAGTPTSPDAVLALVKAYQLRAQLIAPDSPGAGLLQAQLSRKIMELLTPLANEHFDARLLDETSQQTIKQIEGGGLDTLRAAMEQPDRAKRDSIIVKVRELYEAMQRESTEACLDRHTLVRLAPKNLEHRRSLFRCKMLTAALHLASGDCREANAAVNEAWGVQQTTERALPNDTEARRDAAIALDLGALIARQAGDFEEARTLFTRSLDRARKQFIATPNDITAREDLAAALLNLATIEADLGSFREVATHLDEISRLCTPANQGPCPGILALAAETPRAPTWLPLTLRLEVTAVTGLDGRVGPGATCAMYLRPVPTKADDGCSRAVISCNGWRILGTDMSMARLAVAGAPATPRGDCPVRSRVDLSSGRLHVEESSLLGVYTLDALATRQ